MGMSIDEAISRIDEHKYIHQYKEPRAIYITEAFDTLIEVAKKYQKIQEIMNDLNGNFYGSYLKDRQTLEKIYEVVEDGKDND